MLPCSQKNMLIFLTTLWLSANACTETAIRFFTAKYKILKLYPNGHSFFYSEIRKFTIVPKRPFVFLQRNTKFYSCTQTAIRSFTTKYEIFKLKNLKLPPKCHLFFEHEMQYLKLYPNGLSLLNTDSENRNLIIYFYNELLVIQKKPTKLLGNYLIVN